MADSHTNVVEDFSYSSRNHTYNSDYLIWRRHTKGAFIYRFTDVHNENVYVDGDAVAPVTAAYAERAALMQCSQIIGLALLLFLLIAVVGGSVLIALLRLFHIDIRLDFLSLQMDGSQWARVAVKSITAVLKYLLPSLLLLRICKLPRRIVFRPGWPTICDHQRGAPQVVTTAIFRMCPISGVIRPPESSAKATSLAQTRSSQPFSIAGNPYHQVG